MHAPINSWFRSSSRIRHKSDSIQLTVGLQRDRIENGADSFHCDTIARRLAARRRRGANPETKTAAPKRGRGRASTTRHSASERFDSGVQARQLARRGILVNDTLADAAM